MIDLIIPARSKDLGGGLKVGRILPFAKRRMVGPFVFLDHMGPADFSPGDGVDVRPHPHIGLSTISYLFDGELHHHDSLGTVQTIVPGEVNWMTAGRGIVHSERTRAETRAHGYRLDGIQAWVALPNEAEETDPAFAHIGSADLPRFEEGGASGTVIAGEVYGLSGVKGHSPLFYVHLELRLGARFAVPTGYSERAAYVAQGAVRLGDTRLETGHLAVLTPGGADLIAEEGPARLMLLGGEPVGERHIWWNFVSSSLDRIEAAKADWKAGRLPLPPSDRSEFIPLPDVPPPPPPPGPTDPV
jgi:redox-sensitive bicupin YhaK (pirin superfamily)